jgi:hypothetical protein
VIVELDGRTVSFGGLTLLRPHVMIEYDVDPPIASEDFGPHLLILDVTDEVSDDLYPTAWHDFQLRHLGPGRTTTRLDRRPRLERPDYASSCARPSRRAPTAGVRKTRRFHRSRVQHGATGRAIHCGATSDFRLWGRSSSSSAIACTASAKCVRHPTGRGLAALGARLAAGLIPPRPAPACHDRDR